MIAEVPSLEKAMFFDLTPSVISDPSAAQEKFAVWLVVVVAIVAGVEFLACSCASLSQQLITEVT